MIGFSFWGITKADYDRKPKQYKEEQYDIEQQINDHTLADETFYLSATQLINVARKAVVIFERSEPHEKRQLINFVFQNFVLNDRELVYEIRSPMKSIISCKKTSDVKHKTTSISTDRPVWLRVVNDVRTAIFGYDRHLPIPKLFL